MIRSRKYALTHAGHKKPQHLSLYTSATHTVQPCALVCVNVMRFLHQNARKRLKHKGALIFCSHGWVAGRLPFALLVWAHYCLAFIRRFLWLFLQSISGSASGFIHCMTDNHKNRHVDCVRLPEGFIGGNILLGIKLEIKCIVWSGERSYNIPSK